MTHREKLAKIAKWMGWTEEVVKGYPEDINDPQWDPGCGEHNQPVCTYHCWKTPRGKLIGRWTAWDPWKNRDDAAMLLTRAKELGVHEDLAWKVCSKKFTDWPHNNETCFELMCVTPAEISDAVLAMIEEED